MLVDEPEIEQSLYDVPEDSFVAKAVSVDVSVEKFITVQSLYNDFGNKPIQSFYNNNEGDGLGHDEDRFEATTINTDKKDYDMEEFKAVENVPKVMEPVEADIVKADVVGTEVSTDEEIIAQSAELTIEGKAEQIVMAIQKYYKSYDYLTVENKARLFNFRIDDNSYNLELHAGVLKKLGVLMYGSDKFEDYQSIYEETMKRVEKPNSECERRCYNKEWEREKGR